MLKSITFHVTAAPEPSAGLRGLSEVITINLQDGEPDHNAVDFIDALRFAICDYYNADRVETAEEFNSRMASERKFMGED